MVGGDLLDFVDQLIANGRWCLRLVWDVLAVALRKSHGEVTRQAQGHHECLQLFEHPRCFKRV